MKPVDFLIGLAVLFMGLLPFLAKIEAIASRISFKDISSESSVVPIDISRIFFNLRIASLALLAAIVKSQGFKGLFISKLSQLEMNCKNVS